MVDALEKFSRENVLMQRKKKKFYLCGPEKLKNDKL
jgi:hypothetical protein